MIIFITSSILAIVILLRPSCAGQFRKAKLAEPLDLRLPPIKREPRQSCRAPEFLVSNACDIDAGPLRLLTLEPHWIGGIPPIIPFRDSFISQRSSDESLPMSHKGATNEREASLSTGDQIDTIIKAPSLTSIQALRRKSPRARGRFNTPIPPKYPTLATCFDQFPEMDLEGLVRLKKVLPRILLFLHLVRRDHGITYLGEYHANSKISFAQKLREWEQKISEQKLEEIGEKEAKEKFPTLILNSWIAVVAMMNWNLRDKYEYLYGPQDQIDGLLITLAQEMDR